MSGYFNSYNSGYSRSGRNVYYPRSYGGNSYPKKHSGCSLRVMPDGAPVIFGWNYSRGRGLVRLYARPYKGSKTVASKSGKEWINLFVTLTNVKMLDVINTTGLYNKQTGRLYLKEFNLVANPKAPNGGYFGKHISKVYRR